MSTFRSRGAGATFAAALFAAMLMILAAPQAGASQSTLYVSATGSDGNPCTRHAPCATIGHAVSMAAAGDTVVVGPGTYAEDVAISDAIRVVGVHRPVVNALGLSNGFFINGSWASVSGFKIQNATFEGVLVMGASHVSVRHNMVMHNDQGMFDENPVGECAPQGEIPGDCGEGVHLMSVTRSTVANNRISGNAGGILLTDELGPTAKNLIAGNSVVGNRYDCGITMAGHNPNAVASDGTRQPAVAGIYRNVVIDNRSNGNGVSGEGAGILMAGAGPGTGVYHNWILENRVSGNNLSGITVHGHAPNTDINGNVIRGNVVGTNNLGGDPDAGVGPTTGILIFSAVDHVSGTVVRGNVIFRNHFGIWTQNVSRIGKRANTFVHVLVPLHQQ